MALLFDIYCVMTNHITSRQETVNIATPMGCTKNGADDFEICNKFCSPKVILHVITPMSFNKNNGFCEKGKVLEN